MYLFVALPLSVLSSIHTSTFTNCLHTQNCHTNYYILQFIYYNLHKILIQIYTHKKKVMVTHTVLHGVATPHAVEVFSIIFVSTIQFNYHSYNHSYNYYHSHTVTPSVENIHLFLQITGRSFG